DDGAETVPAPVPCNRARRSFSARFSASAILPMTMSDSVCFGNDRRFLRSHQRRRPTGRAMVPVKPVWS
ncbi:MAG: hypothetical protein D6788_09910, partial [Planctomycetota bacterium]